MSAWMRNKQSRARQRAVVLQAFYPVFRVQSSRRLSLNQEDQTARMPVLQRLLHALCDDFLNRIAVIDLQPLLSGNNQSPRIQAQLVQYRGMNVGHVMPILDGVEA